MLEITVQDVCANREIVAEKLNFSNSNIGLEQSRHMIIKIKKISKHDRGNGCYDIYDTAFKGTDGFYTNEEGILLTLCFADCVPLFFIAPEKQR